YAIVARGLQPFRVSAEKPAEAIHSQHSPDSNQPDSLACEEHSPAGPSRVFRLELWRQLELHEVSGRVLGDSIRLEESAGKSESVSAVHRHRRGLRYSLLLCEGPRTETPAADPHSRLARFGV